MALKRIKMEINKVDLSYCFVLGTYLSKYLNTYGKYYGWVVRGTGVAPLACPALVELLESLYCRPSYPPYRIGAS